MKINKIALTIALLGLSSISQASYNNNSGKCKEPIYQPHTNISQFCTDFYIQKELDRSVKEGNKLYQKKNQEQYALSILEYAKNEGHHFVYFDLYSKLKTKNRPEAMQHLKASALHGHKKGMSLYIMELIKEKEFDKAYSFFLVAKRLGYSTEVTESTFDNLQSKDKRFSLSNARMKHHQHNARNLFKNIKANNILINEFGYMTTGDQEKLKNLFLSNKSIENSLNIAGTMERYLDEHYNNDLYVDHVLIMNEYYLRAALNESTYALNKLGDSYYRFSNVKSFYHDYTTRLTDYKTIDFYLMSMEKGDNKGFEGYVKMILENNISLREETLDILVSFLNGDYASKPKDKHWDIGHFIAKEYHRLGYRQQAFEWAVDSIGKGTTKYDYISRQVLKEIKSK